MSQTSLEHFTLAPLLFKKYDLAGSYYKNLEEARLKIRELDRRYFLQTNEEDLVRYYLDEYSFNPLKLHLDNITRTDKMVGVDVSQDFQRAIFDRSRPFYNPTPQVNFHIPFEGNADLFDCAPYLSLNPPRGEVNGQTLTVPILAYDGNIARIAAQFETEKNKIVSSVEAINKIIEQENNKFSEQILSAIRSQKNIFDKQQAELDALPYPISGSERKVEIIRRRVLPISTLPPTSSVSVETPILPLAEYNFILKTMFGMARVIESNPKSFESLTEPAIRDHFLIQLNGLYEGLAKGESFNGHGKTDILIPYKNENIFIAECKFYEGKQSVLDAIDQLLGYTMWRDSKTALLLFSRRADFTNVLQTIKDVISEHSQFVRVIENQTEEATLFKYEFKHRADPKRKFLFSILTFNINAE